MFLGGADFLDPDGPMCPRVNPEKWVLPMVCEFYLDRVVAD